MICYTPNWDSCEKNAYMSFPDTRAPMGQDFYQSRIIALLPMTMRAPALFPEQI